MKTFRMNSKIPAPTIVPTSVADSNGMLVTFANEGKRTDAAKFIPITTAMIAETNPVTYSLTSTIFINLIEFFSLSYKEVIKSKD